MSVTPQQVQKLREVTGAGILDCKKALESTSGDFDQAIQQLREKGKASAAQKAGRAAKEGLVCSWISVDGKKGGLVEINCETDFVARTEEFKKFALSLAQCVADLKIQTLESLMDQKLGGSSETVESLLKEKIGKLGENILVKKVASFGNGSSLLGSYIHMPLEKTPQAGRLGVLMEAKMDQENPEAKILLREICMQVAATSPKWVRKEEVPSSIVEKEKRIYKEQCKQSGKPETAWEKIVDGKLKDFYRQFCLLEQAHIRDSSGKISIAAYIESSVQKLGIRLAIQRFSRFKLGEE